MVSVGDTVCPRCGGYLKYYDMVKRIVRTKDRRTNYIFIRRLRCCKCGAMHRELPLFLFPYKQYEAELIFGVCNGLISSDTLGYEDYPCETTMRRWCARYLQRL